MADDFQLGHTLEFGKYSVCNAAGPLDVAFFVEHQVERFYILLRHMSAGDEFAADALALAENLYVLPTDTVELIKVGSVVHVVPYMDTFKGQSHIVFPGSLLSVYK